MYTLLNGDDIYMYVPYINFCILFNVRSGIMMTRSMQISHKFMHFFLKFKIQIYGEKI